MVSKESTSENPSKLLHLKELELNSLLEITQAINSNISEEALYKIYHFTIIANLNIQKLALYVKDEAWVCKANYGTDTNFKKEALAPEILYIDTISTIPSSVLLFNEFETVIPIFHKSKALAYVLISNLKSENTVDALTTSFIQTFTNIIIVAIENKKMARKELEQQAFLKELEIAKEVQALLFPKNLPCKDPVHIKATYHPHGSIGGDYYDYIKISETKFMVCIADVSGKGIPAALLMSNFQASLRTLVRQTNDLKIIVEELNHNILSNAKGEKFITFFIGEVNLETNVLRYINAGHNPPILISKGQNLLLDKGATILGIFDKLPFVNEQEVIFDRPSLIFAYTDGLTETASEEDEEFGNERLEEYLKHQEINNHEAIHSELYDMLKVFKGKTSFPDDITYWTCLVK